mmetsp:Transcript_5156/g.12368  ORF Transcript_5156/g.12368 Transcript_5156/m.12368 type:complete len:91 (+) Transcript_5156:652-924(+)
MFGSLLTIVVARGAAFGEKAAAEPSASARTVLAIAAACLRGVWRSICRLGGVSAAAFRESLSLPDQCCKTPRVKPNISISARVCTDAGVY